MKKYFLMAALNITFTSNVLATGIPVVDAANIEQTVQSHMETIQQMITQFNKLQEQLNVQKSSLEAQTGIKDIVKLYDKSMKAYKGLKDVYSQISNPDDLFTKGVDAIKGDARKLLDQLKVSQTCKVKYMNQPKNQKLCEGEAINVIGQINAQDEYIKNIDSAVNQLQIIGKKMATATDIKQATDLHNQLSILVSSMEAQQLAFEVQESKAKTMDYYASEQKKNVFNYNLGRIESSKGSNTKNSKTSKTW